MKLSRLIRVGAHDYIRIKFLDTGSKTRFARAWKQRYGVPFDESWRKESDGSYTIIGYDSYAVELTYDLRGGPTDARFTIMDEG